VTTFSLGYSNCGERGVTGNPVRKVTAGVPPSPPDQYFAAAIKPQATASEVGEKSEMEITLKVGSCNKSAEETREGYLNLAGLAQRLLKPERCSHARGFKQSV
jgi:hypothetical protein